MKLLKYLANLGYGTRRDVARMLADGRVCVADGSKLRDGDGVAHDDIRLDGAPLDPAPGVVIMLHKPPDTVCSTKGPERLVYELLPPRFLLRSPVLATVGRLDRETTGLLLLTDDGVLNHRLTSPRSHVAKTYRATLATALHDHDLQRLAAGTLCLAGETSPLMPALLEMLDECIVLVTIAEGRYHQVRRMFAAVGNHVTALHRVQVGTLTLGELPPGDWRVLDADDVARLFAPATSRPASYPISSPAAP